MTIKNVKTVITLSIVYVQEEERRLLEEAEIKRMKELKVKEELELLLERSRKRQAEEERLARFERMKRGRFFWRFSNTMSSSLLNVILLMYKIVVAVTPDYHLVNKMIIGLQRTNSSVKGVNF